MADDIVVADPFGDFTLDAETVARSFGWSARELREHMRRGLVSSLVERGEGEDEGFWRLSLRCGNRRWRAIVAGNGAIVENHVEFTGRAG